MTRNIPMPGQPVKKTRKQTKRKRKPKKWVSKRTESAILKDCLHWLQANSIYCWRNNTGALPTGNGGFIRYGHAGSGDITGWTKSGRRLEVECKTADGRQSPAQVAFQAACEKDGVLYILARGAIDLENFRKELTRGTN